MKVKSDIGDVAPRYDVFLGHIGQSPVFVIHKGEVQFLSAVHFGSGKEEVKLVNWFH